jgi:predicted Fe-Mo cluster-binding NifX family protein
MKNIVFAFALSSDDIFTKEYFGNSDKFVIYEYAEGELMLKEKIQNPFVNSNQEISADEKREKIVSILKSRDVSVLVAQQYSKKLRLVTDDFIPVLIEKENPEQVVEVLNKNIKWITDELKSRKADHMLFRINTGVLKLAIH